MQAGGSIVDARLSRPARDPIQPASSAGPRRRRDLRRPLDRGAAATCVVRGGAGTRRSALSGTGGGRGRLHTPPPRGDAGAGPYGAAFPDDLPSEDDVKAARTDQADPAACVVLFVASAGGWAHKGGDLAVEAVRALREGLPGETPAWVEPDRLHDRRRTQEMWRLASRPPEYEGCRAPPERLSDEELPDEEAEHRAWVQRKVEEARRQRGDEWMRDREWTRVLEPYGLDMEEDQTWSREREWRKEEYSAGRLRQTQHAAMVVRRAAALRNARLVCLGDGPPGDVPDWVEVRGWCDRATARGRETFRNSLLEAQGARAEIDEAEATPRISRPRAKSRRRRGDVAERVRGLVSGDAAATPRISSEGSTPRISSEGSDDAAERVRAATPRRRRLCIPTTLSAGTCSSCRRARTFTA